MSHIRKLCWAGSSILLYLHASPLDIVVRYAACRSLGAILEALDGVIYKILQAKFAEFTFYEVG